MYEQATTSRKLAGRAKPTNNRKDFAKIAQVPAQLNQQEQEEHYEQTMAKPLAIPKIKISFDEEETKKIGWEKGFSALSKCEISAPVSKNPPVVHSSAGVEQPAFQIPYNKKVDQIMSKKPLRERLSGLLPYEMQLPISFDHQQILKRMELIDRTIEFMESHRGVKLFFFEAIKKSIYETSSVVIQLKLIQQLLYLDSACYDVEWKINEKNNKYDIRLSLPKFQSMDLRKSEMRKKIVKFLIFKQGEFLASKKLAKIELHKWHQLFDYKKVDIPEKSLPVHPLQSESDLRAFPDQQIDKITNPALKSLFKKKKNMSEVKSLSSASVVDMIFSKVPACEISNQIFNLVKQKEKINNELKQQNKEQGEKIDRQAMLKIYDEILLIFMSKNVGNIFKVTLIELLQQRLQLKNQVISHYVDELLKLEGMEFLKIIQSSRKIDVVQIDKQKYKDMRALVSTKF